MINVSTILSTLLDLLARMLTGILWLMYGPISGLLPVVLLYGMLECGLLFHAANSPRERQLMACFVVTSLVGLVVWLTRYHLQPLILGLLAVCIAATVVAFVRSRPRKHRSSAAAVTKELPDDQETVHPQGRSAQV
jgi:hypothetical protein